MLAQRLCCVHPQLCLKLTPKIDLAGAVFYVCRFILFCFFFLMWRKKSLPHCLFLLLKWNWNRWKVEYKNLCLGDIMMEYCWKINFPMSVLWISKWALFTQIFAEIINKYEAWRLWLKEWWINCNLMYKNFI